MRRILKLPDDVHHIAKSLGDVRGVSLCEAAAEFVRQGLKPPARVNTRKPFPCFVPPKDAKPITLDQTLQAEDEL